MWWQQPKKIKHPAAKESNSFRTIVLVSYGIHLKPRISICCNDSLQNVAQLMLYGIVEVSTDNIQKRLRRREDEGRSDPQKRK